MGIWKSQAGAVDIAVLRFGLCNFSVLLAAILKQEKHLEVYTFGAVSYTHLTLPTNREV